MPINIKQFIEWVKENPNFSESDTKMIQYAVEQYESDCIDREME